MDNSNNKQDLSDEEESFDSQFTLTKKVIKLDDDGDNEADNVICIREQKNHNASTAGKIWESAVILGKYLLEQCALGKLDLKDQNILDIGAGTGILSIMLASQGANVLATDLVEAQNLCELNIRENKQVFKFNSGSVKFVFLDWQFNTIKLEQTLGKFTEKINFIVASDCIYNTQTLVSFVQFLKQVYDILSNKSTITYLAHKQRHEKIDSELQSSLEANGFWIETIKFDSQSTEWRNKSVQLFMVGKNN